jgi:hypothetical protein
MRLPWITVLGAIGWAAASLATAADSFTVGVLSCAAETDRDRRLECYDRAVASYTAGLAGGKRDAVAGVAPSGVTSPGAPTGRPTPAPTPGNSASTPTTARQTASVAGAPAVAANGTSAVAGSAPAVAPSGAAAVGGSPPAGGDSAAPVAGAGKSAAPRHVAAHISSVEYFSDYVVLHLDNQQTWKQVSDSPGSPVLRKGDPVTIDRQLGSYWLAGPKGEALQVQLEAPKP